ncbi:MAG: hypothetical protein ACP5HK_05720 [Acidilobus sp.]
MRVFGKGSPNGVFRLDPNAMEWVQVPEAPEPLEPEERYAVIYFDNALCPVCRQYDGFWYPFLEMRARDLHSAGFGFYVVLCDWFLDRCSSVRAGMSFLHYDVKASPTTILVANEGGGELYLERYEGLLTVGDLDRMSTGFPERAGRARRGERVEKALTSDEAALSLLNSSIPTQS